MPSVIFGLLSLALALWGLTAWWWSVTEFLRGVLPIALLLFGVVALASGVQSVREPNGSRKSAGDLEGDN
jgi:hypothetical protein